MSDYENRPVPEGINISPSHPLKEFGLLVGGISAVLLTGVLLLALLAGHLVRYVPFAQEKALLSGVDIGWLKDDPNPAKQQKQRYLQALAERLATNMQLPPGMSFSLHYSPEATVNAMATLGGHIVVYQGLLDTLPSENALAMVLAHEMAHVRQRHPIVAVGRGFAVMLALSSLAGVGDGAMQQWVGNMGMLSMLSFSRAQEEDADAEALQTVQRTYGHVGDAAAFFEYIAGQPQSLETPAVFNTHPDHAARIARIRQFAQAHPAAAGQTLTPLPVFLQKH